MTYNTNIKVGNFSNTALRFELENRKIPMELLEKLQDINYCKKKLFLRGLKFPFLSKNQMIDANCYPRSYAKALYINNQKFYMYSQLGRENLEPLQLLWVLIKSYPTK